jgi:hypothetical protein
MKRLNVCIDSMCVLLYSNVMLIKNEMQNVSVSEPLKSRARNYLLDQIRRGQLLPGQPIPSVRDLSKDLAVSTSVTFSAIKELRTERILERVANGRHLVGREVIRALQNRSLRVGFCSLGIDHIREGIYQSIFNHLTRLAKSNLINIDCLLELHNTWSGLEPNYYDLMIVSDWIPQDASRLCHGPTLGLDTRGIKVDSVVKTDHFKGGELAGKHLREKGRTRVVYWDNVKEEAGEFQGIVYRRLGFYKGWVDGGGSLDEIKHLPVMTTEKQDLKPLVEQHLKDADAFFVFWDCGALRMWETLTKMGVRVPEDIALMGYDGSYDAVKHDPPLTSIRQPCREIAETLAKLLNTWDGRPESLADKEFLIPPTLLAGGST